MKSFYLLLLLCFSLLSFAPLQGGKDEMITSLKEGSADNFIKYFDNAIDIKLLNSDEMKGVPKAQAASTIRSFFTNNNITSFEVTSQRELGTTMYVTGKLQGASVYNLTSIVKSTGGKFSIVTLRINN